jgi:transposase
VFDVLPEHGTLHSNTKSAFRWLRRKTQHIEAGQNRKAFVRYSSTKIRQQIADEGALAVIPSKSNTRKPIPHNPSLYAMRNIVERFFCKMKDIRRLVARFEKPATGFRPMLLIFAFRCWAN